MEGHPPFGGSGSWAVFVAVATEEPAPAVRAGELGPVLTGLLRKDPARRLTAQEAYELLVGPAGEAEPSRTAPPPTAASTLRLGASPGAGPGAGRPAPPAPGPVRPARRGYLAGGLAAVLVAAVIAMPWWLPASRSPDGDTGRTRVSDSTASSPHSPSASPSPSAASATPAAPPVPTPGPAP